MLLALSLLHSQEPEHQGGFVHPGLWLGRAGGSEASVCGWGQLGSFCLPLQDPRRRSRPGRPLPIMEQAKVEHLGGQGSTGSHSFRSQVTVLSGPGTF